MLLLLFCCFTICGCVIYDLLVTSKFELHFFAYNNITLISSIFLFCKFIFIKPSWFVKKLAHLAPYSFAVYLIHCNYYVWSFLVDIIHIIPASWFAFYNLFFSLVVFCSCMIIDFVVSKLLNTIHFDQFVKSVSWVLEKGIHEKLNKEL